MNLQPEKGVHVELGERSYQISIGNGKGKF